MVWASIRCCSSVSQLRTKDCFPSAFRSYFAWFGHLACVSYGLGINPAAVRVFRNCGQKIVFHRLFDHISHGLGIDPASFLMRSLGDVRHFSACVSYGLGFNPAAVRVLRNCGQKIVFHRLFDRISHGLGIDPSSFLRRSLGDVRHFSGLCFVWFGHQSCCCSDVSEAFLPVIPSNGFPSVKLTFILTLDQGRLTIRSPSSSRLGGRDLPSQKQKGSISIWHDFRHWFSPLETLFFHIGSGALARAYSLECFSIF